MNPVSLYSRIILSSPSHHSALIYPQACKGEEPVYATPVIGQKARRGATCARDLHYMVSRRALMRPRSVVLILGSQSFYGPV